MPARNRRTGSHGHFSAARPAPAAAARRRRRSAEARTTKMHMKTNPSPLTKRTPVHHLVEIVRTAAAAHHLDAQLLHHLFSPVSPVHATAAEPPTDAEDSILSSSSSVAHSRCVFKIGHSNI